jgi:hypothetical protein
MQPAVDAVQADIVRESIVMVPENVVIVQVVPPTHVAASSVTVSPATGADAPVAPPLVVDHIAVEVLSQVQVVVQTANRAAAWATSGAQHASARSKRPNSLFMTRFL